MSEDDNRSHEGEFDNGRWKPPPEPPTLVPPLLTDRETVIATHLRDDITLTTIAAELYVSRNTVKSQASSLYRKLGVGSREEAVTFLERAGFYDTPH